MTSQVPSSSLLSPISSSGAMLSQEEKMKFLRPRLETQKWRDGRTVSERAADESSVNDTNLTQL